MIREGIFNNHKTKINKKLSFVTLAHINNPSIINQ